MILSHQYTLSEQNNRDFGIEEAAEHWYTNFHLPTILLLKRVLAEGQDPMQAYFAVMEYKWQAYKGGDDITLEDAVLAWAVQQTEIGTIGQMDPALIATWWHELTPAAQVLERPLIKTEALEPLLSSGEQSLIHLPTEELELKLPEILLGDSPPE
jgi:hypothetical protein